MRARRRLTVTPGQRFGRLVVADPDRRVTYPSGRTDRAALCECDCGRLALVSLYHLVTGNTRSCSCWQHESRAALMAAMPRDAHGHVTSPGTQAR